MTVNVMADNIAVGEGVQKTPLQDTSLWFLVAANILTIAIAIFDNWNLVSIMFVYWSQSVIIGIFNFFKILSLANFSTEGLGADNKRVPMVKAVKVGTALTFLYTYGFIHFCYLIFIITFAFAPEVFNPHDEASMSAGVFVAILGFLINHWFSYLHNRERDSKKMLNLAKIWKRPYVRILPMHLTIVFGIGVAMAGYWSLALVLFLTLKLLADVIMHIKEHADLPPDKLSVNNQ